MNSVMTPDTIKKLEEAFLIGCTDVEACLVAGINKATLYRYQNEHPDFIERKETLKKTPTYRARLTVVNDIATNPDMAMKYLERKENTEFSTKQDINNTHTFTQMPSIKIGGGEIDFNVGSEPE